MSGLLLRTKGWRELLGDAAAQPTEDAAADGAVQAIERLIAEDRRAELLTVERVQRIMRACQRAGWRFGLSGVQPPTG